MAPRRDDEELAERAELSPRGLINLERGERTHWLGLCLQRWGRVCRPFVEVIVGFMAHREKMSGERLRKEKSVTSRFTELVIDCHDPHRLAAFWCGVLGYRILEDQGEEVEIAGWDPAAEEVRRAPTPPTLLFIRVPESKTVKNRLHIDVSPVDCSQEAEVERLLALGARHVDIGQGEQSWVVLADPEGNEFCVLRSLYSPTAGD